MNLRRGMNLRDVIKVAQSIPGVRITRNGSNETTFWCDRLSPPRFSASSHRRDTPWGLTTFLKRAAEASGTKVST